MAQLWRRFVISCGFGVLDETESQVSNSLPSSAAIKVVVNLENG